jgi:hypothetical protein
VRGFDVDHSFDFLDGAFNGEEWFLVDDEAGCFIKLRRHDGIGDAGFVLDAQEEDAFGGAGALAANEPMMTSSPLRAAGKSEVR